MEPSPLNALPLALGPYEVLDRLGEGGMGTVYKARHRKLGRIVALKVVREGRLSGPAVLQRFLREVRAASRVNHPNIVLAYDADQLGETAYIAMEYVEGVDLARRLRQQGAMLVSEAVLCAVQALRGLEHAHKMGLVHRDVKPSNLMLTQRPEGPLVKVLDLGLARLHALSGDAEQSATLTREGVIVGTPDYIAPEQIRDPHAADARADVYSVGCTLYHLLAGRPPCPDSALGAKLLFHQTEEPQPIEQRRSDVSAALGNVLRRMMARSPADRYPSAAAAADALEGVLQGRPPDEPPPSLSTLPTLADVPTTDTVPPSAPPRPRRLKLILVAVAALALGLALPAINLWLHRDEKPDPRPEPRPLSSLDRLDPSAIPTRERFPAWQPASLVAVLGEHGLRHPGEHAGGAARCVVWGEAGVGWLASGGADGMVRLWDAATGRERQALQLPNALRAVSLALSADGKRLAVADASTHVTVWERSGKQFLDAVLPKRPGMRLMAVALSPDGSTLAVGAETGQVLLWPLGREDAAPVEAAVHQSTVVGLTFAENDTLFSAGAEGQIFRLKRQGGAWKRDRVWRHPAVSALALSPDGRTLATGSSEGTIRLWDARGDAEQARAGFQAHGGSILGLSFRRDSALLASGGQDTLVKLWDLKTELPGTPVTLPDPRAGIAFGLAFGPDGTLAVADGARGVRLWQDAGKEWKERFPPEVGSSRVDLQACKLEYSIVSPK